MRPQGPLANGLSLFLGFLGFSVGRGIQLSRGVSILGSPSRFSNIWVEVVFGLKKKSFEQPGPDEREGTILSRSSQPRFLDHCSHNGVRDEGPLVY